MAHSKPSTTRLHSGRFVFWHNYKAKREGKAFVQELGLFPAHPIQFLSRILTILPIDILSPVLSPTCVGQWLHVGSLMTS